MSTHRQELLDLQAKARHSGRTCDFTLDNEGRIDGVFYRDPEAGAGNLTRQGMTLGPIAFAEIERAKPESHRAQVRTGKLPVRFLHGDLSITVEATTPNRLNIRAFAREGDKPVTWLGSKGFETRYVLATNPIDALRDLAAGLKLDAEKLIDGYCAAF